MTQPDRPARWVRRLGAPTVEAEAEAPAGRTADLSRAAGWANRFEARRFASEHRWHGTGVVDFLTTRLAEPGQGPAGPTREP